MDSQQKILDAHSIFSNGFLCGKSLYLYCFGQVPNANYVNYIDGEKAFKAIQSTFGHLVKAEHSYRYYDRKKRRYVFNFFDHAQWLHYRV